MPIEALNELIRIDFDADKCLQALTIYIIVFLHPLN